MSTSQTERDPRLRCRSEHVQAPGRTHHCKMGLLHDGHQHQCICGRTWDRRTPVTSA